MDLNITRWSKLKYKVVRSNDFSQDERNSIMDRDFYKQENPDKEVRDARKE